MEVLFWAAGECEGVTSLAAADVEDGIGGIELIGEGGEDCFGGFAEVVIGFGVGGVLIVMSDKVSSTYWISKDV